MAYIVTKDDVLRNFRDFSGQLSAQCRTLSAGILGFVWTLMTRGSSPSQTPQLLGGHLNLVGIATIVILALFTDATQYYAALRVQEVCLKKLAKAAKHSGDLGTSENPDDGTQRYTDAVTCPHDFWYSVQFWAFKAKFIALGAGVVWLLGYMLYLLSNGK